MEVDCLEFEIKLVMVSSKAGLQEEGRPARPSVRPIISMGTSPIMFLSSAIKLSSFEAELPRR